MASLEQRNGTYRIVFRYAGKKLSQSLATEKESVALGLKASLEERIKLIRTKMLPPPPVDCVIAEYLIHGISVPVEPSVPSVSQPVKFYELCERFFDSFLRSSIEDESFDMLQTHKRNLVRHLGQKIIRRISQGTAQEYINKRSEEPGIRGNRVAAVTIRKEITTFNSILKWAKAEGLIEATIDFKNLRYPKGKEKPPFQTLQEIKQAISRNNLTDSAKNELWDCLFLSTDEIALLLEHVKANATYSFIYPMFAFAAFTGARRSEMLRSQIDDLDFGAKRITIREKKRLRGRTSTRRVPMSKTLHQILTTWKDNHPGGMYTFCFENVDFGRKKRLNGQPVDTDEAHRNFKSTLRHSQWSDIRGWHCLRHSFCSNCAAAGIEQQIINDWVGHQTDEMVRRYRHRFPSKQQEAIAKVFS